MSENNDKKEKISVKIDTERTEQLCRENERLRIEKEQRDALEDMDIRTSDNKSIAEGVKDALRQKYQDKGHTAPTLETEADLKNAVEILKDLPDKKAPSGSAPLNSAQWGENGQPPTYDAHGDLMNKKYPSYEAMLEDLHDREAVFGRSQKGLEATRMLEAVTRKFFEEHKANNSPVPVLQKPMPKLVQANGLLQPEDPSTGDLQERNRIYRRRKLLERQERGSVAVKGEDQ